jgi:parvulin-like peptidyl-prolyl isomerase
MASFLLAPEKRAIGWLLAGVVAGVGLAAHGLLASGSGKALPDRAVASVNGALIFADEFERLVAGLESDTREPASPETRRRVLDRMIEEELLVQRGLELGLAESDRRVRSDITAAMIRSVVVEAEDEPPADDEVRAFYEQERAFFTQPGRLHVRQIFFRVPTVADEAGAAGRAQAARQRLLEGEAPEQVAATLADEPVSPLPDTLLPPAKLREYLGPTALRTALELAPGEWSEPVRSGIGYHLLRVVAAEPASTPPYGEIEGQVRAEFVRRAGDRALRRYLDELRDRAEVTVSPELE